MAPVEDAAVAAGGADAVKPYKIRVSSRYIDLTRQKLELARLPHEGLVSRSRDWWEPKTEVESLIDFWLEQYSWRTQEDSFNAQFADSQFRTAFTSPAADPEAPALRLHFIHVRSKHANALPLLLIPPFPFANVSLAHLVQPLVNPGGDDNTSKEQAFHLVIPALPGLGFSDALPNNAPAISSTADMLNSLMLRLGYDHYLATSSGPGTTSPAQIDYKLVDFLAACYSDHCLGAHLIAPPLPQPSLKQNPLEWAKWSVASVLRRDLFGYKPQDFSAKPRLWPIKQATALPQPSASFSLHSVGLREPNTLAYALCDSPTGLLVQVMNNLRTLGPKKEFTQTEVLDFTQLSWLPGPEAALRFWASCSQNPETVKSSQVSKPKVSITVFQDFETGKSVSLEEGSSNTTATEAEASTTATRDPTSADAGKSLSTSLKMSYTCPAWASSRYQLVHTIRAPGSPGLLAWERPEIIAEGARSLAAAILRLDSRLQPSSSGNSTTPLAGVIVDGEQSTARSSSAVSRTANAGSTAPPPLTQSPSGHLVPPATLAERVQPQREISDETAVSTGSNGNAPSEPPKTSLTVDERARPSRELSDETAVNSTKDNLSGQTSPVPQNSTSPSSLPTSASLSPPQPPQAGPEQVKEEAPPAAIVVTAAEEEADAKSTKAAGES